MLGLAWSGCTKCQLKYVIVIKLGHTSAISIELSRLVLWEADVFRRGCCEAPVVADELRVLGGAIMQTGKLYDPGTRITKEMQQECDRT